MVLLYLNATLTLTMAAANNLSVSTSESYTSQQY